MLFASKKIIQKLASLYGTPLPEFVNFETRTKLSDWLDPRTDCWTNDLPPLNHFDEIVSDNLIEILKLYPNAWLSGSFFWHEALPNFPIQRANCAEELLSKYRPRMISTDLFAQPYLAEKARLFTVGMYRIGREVRQNSGLGILVSCGTGGCLEKVVCSLVRKISCEPKPWGVSVWVEPCCYESSMPKWIQPADFTPSMYEKITAAVIRPGVGTVTDTLLARGRLFMFFEEENREMALNAGRLSDLGVGEALNSAENAWRSAVKFVLKRHNFPDNSAIFNTLDFNGAEQAAELLLGRQR